MDRRVFYSLLVFSFVLLVLYLVYSVLSPFIVPLGCAMVIGISTWPVYRRLRCRLHCHDNITAALMTAASFLVLVLPVFGLLFLLSVEVVEAYHYFEGLNAAGKLNLDTLLAHPAVAPLVERVRPYVADLQINVQETVMPAVNRMSTYLVGYSTSIIKNVFAFIFKVVIMIIALFFFYRDGERFLERFWSVVHLEQEEKEVIIGTVRRVLSGVIYGVFLTCCVQGTLGGIGYAVAGLPSPALLGAMTAVCAVIPFVGTALVWVPGVIYLLLQGDVFWGVALGIWGAVAIGSSDNLFRPLFISGKAQIHILVTALGGIGGLAAFGIFGVVAGPLLLALFINIVDMYVKMMYRKQET